MTYTAAVLTKESRKRLLELVPPAFADVRADHVTLAINPSDDVLADFGEGVTVKFQAVGHVTLGGVQAVMVRGITNTTGHPPHITVSLAPGRKASESGPLLAAHKAKMLKATTLEARLRVFKSPSAQGVSKPSP